jgi:RNA polymerase sigma-70 factor (ECF subfamily)
MTSIPSDESLMVAVRDAARDGLGELFERHQLALYGFFFRMAGDRVSSEDLVQEVFYRILKYRHTFRDGSSFRTWMYGIARNAHRDHCRMQRTDTPFVENSAAMPRSASLSNGLEWNEQAEALQCALLKLPEDRRELIVLSQCQEMSSDEVAGVLGITPGTARVRIHRAMKELRAIFLKLSAEKPLCSVKKSEPTLRTI